MKNLFKELRRRQVFRTAGLYIGAAWIVLQVVEFLLPVYDAPVWILKAGIYIAIVGLPIAIALAWVLDIDSSGVHLEGTAEPDSLPQPGGRRKGDFVVIGVLLVALAGSLFGNFAPREPAVLEVIEPISILIADFNNSTGDTVFNGALEQALTIAIEESSFITAFDRNSANRVLAEIEEGSKLYTSGARLVSAREGIDIVLSGQLSEKKGKYEIAITAIDVESGGELANFTNRADTKSEVLGAVGSLARSLREKLGDVKIDITQGVETFTTMSLEAMHDYVEAQRLARDGNDEEALGLYQSSVAKDPRFGRAWSGLAVSADKLGKSDAAAEAWQKAMQLLDSMTERERYRTAGAYYSLVARNSQKAIDNYETLVESYPSDDAGFNNLAVSYFMALQFDKALEAGRKVVDIYPSKPMYHANYSLYAMYASDFESAKSEAAITLELNPNYHKAYLPYAVAALVEGDKESARKAYDDMAKTGARGASLANIGVADMLLWSDDAAGAETTLLEGMQADEAAENKRALATKKMIYSYALLQQGKDVNEVSATVIEALALSSSMSQLVPAALMYVELGKDKEAAAVATELSGSLNVQRRAYAKLIDALLLAKKGETIAAVDTLQEALELADVWLVRFYLGQAYFNAGHYAEAVAEFTLCKERQGEAYSLYLDDTPTFRYTAELDAWINQAREKMTSSL